MHFLTQLRTMNCKTDRQNKIQKRVKNLKTFQIKGKKIELLICCFTFRVQTMTRDYFIVLSCTYLHAVFFVPFPSSPTYFCRAVCFVCRHLKSKDFGNDTKGIRHTKSMQRVTSVPMICRNLGLKAAGNF